MADKYAGPLAGAPYFGRYRRLTTPWRTTVGEVDGEPVVIVLEPAAVGWVLQAIVRIAVSAQHVVSITDYTLCPWVLASAAGWL